MAPRKETTMATEILDDVDNVIEIVPRTFVDLALTVEDVYTVLEALYFDSSNPPLKVLDIIKQIEYTLLDHDLPADRAEYSAQGMVNHQENEQYKRIAYWLNAEHNEE